MGPCVFPSVQISVLATTSVRLEEVLRKRWEGGRKKEEVEEEFKEPCV